MRLFSISILLCLVVGCTSVTVKNLRYRDKDKTYSVSEVVYYNQENVDLSRLFPCPKPEPKERR